jgi:hypothetical protein
MQRFATVALAISSLIGTRSIAPAQTQSSQPAEFIQVITTTVSPNAVAEYEDFIKRIKAGADNLGAPQRWTVSQVSIGGPGFTYSIVLPFSKWAEVDQWMVAPDLQKVSSSS